MPIENEQGGGESTGAEGQEQQAVAAAAAGEGGGEQPAAGAEGQQPAAGAEGGEQQRADKPVDKRAAIYERARANRAAQVAEDPERVAALSQMTGQGEPAAAAAEGAAATGAEAATTEGVQEGAEKKGDEGLALNARTRTVKVDGQEIEVGEDEIIQAGIRTLQKDRSADQKLRLAASQLAEVERQRKALQDSGRLPEQGAGHDGASSHPSAQDAGESEQAALRAAAEQARDVLFDDADPDKAAKVLLESARKSAVAVANDLFANDFADITGDPDLFREAASRMQAELRKNPSPARIPVLAERIGNALRAEKFGRELQQQPAPGGDGGNAEGTDAAGQARSKAATKVRLPSVPSRAAARTPDSRPAAKPAPTRSQIVHNMRVARGQVPGQRPS